MFNQIFQIPLAARSCLFFVPAQAFVWPLGEPIHRNNLCKNKSGKGGEGEGASFSLYQFHNLVHRVTAWALPPAQRREWHWPETKLLADRKRQDRNACLCWFIQIINCGVWFQPGVGRWVPANIDLMLFNCCHQPSLKNQEIEQGKTKNINLVLILLPLVPIQQNLIFQKKAFVLMSYCNYGLVKNK